MNRLFKLSLFAVMLALVLSIGVAYAEDVKLENVIVDSAVTKIDKKGNEFVRIIFTEQRSIDGIEYPAGTPLMAFGDMVTKAKALKSGDTINVIADRTVYQGRVSYSIRTFF